MYMALHRIEEASFWPTDIHMQQIELVYPSLGLSL